MKNSIHFISSFIVIIILYCGTVFSQNQKTPAATIFKHESNLRLDNYKPAKAGQTLYGAGTNDAPRLAEQLKKVMDAYGIAVDTNLLSNDPDFIDTVSGKHVYYPFENHKKIYLQKVGNEWYYSQETVKHIPDLYKSVFPRGSETISFYLKKLGNGVFLGYEQWQWIGLLLILFGSAALYFITYYISKKLVKAVTQRRIVQNEKSVKIVSSFAKLFSLLMAVRFIRMLYPLLLLPLGFNSSILLITGIAQAVFFGYMLYRVVDVISLIAAKIAANTVSTLDDQLIPLARKLAKAIIILGTILLVLGLTGVNLTALLAGLSIGGLALAFAAQDTVKNIFGSMMLLLDRTFQIGDHIFIPSIDNIEGTVEEVGLRSTRIRTFDNSLITVPNGKLADAAINNLGMRVQRRYKFNLGITYDTPPELISQFVAGVRQLMDIHPLVNIDTIQVHLHNFDASSLTLRCSCYFKTQDFNLELESRQELMLDIIRLAELLEIRFAFPTNTMHIENMPEKTSLTPVYTINSSENMNKVNRLIEQIRREREAGKEQADEAQD